MTDGLGRALEGEVAGPAGGSGANWLWAVPDDQSDLDDTVMLSVEDTSTNKSAIGATGLFMGRLDLGGLVGRHGSFAALPAVSWTEIDTGTGTLGAGTDLIADHAHVAARGYHWIAVATATNIDDVPVQVWLLRVDPATVSGSGPVAPGAAVLVYDEDSAVGSLVPGAEGDCLVNDLFMFVSPGGVTVAIRYTPDRALLFIEVDSAMGLVGTSLVGGTSSGSLELNVTGSGVNTRARRAGTPLFGFSVPDQVVVTSFVPALYYWESAVPGTSPAAADAELPLATSADYGVYYYAMATTVHFPSGDRLFTFRRLPVAGTYGDGTAVVSDYGEVVRELFDDAWNSLGQDVVAVASAASAANRPHARRFKRYLLTTWSSYDVAAGQPDGVRLRVDFLEATP